MTQITLSDYVGFIFSEIVRARTITDAETKRIALLYKEDEILKNFSVPRFKIPEMELSIPVLVSGARFKSTMKFNVEQQPFTEYIKNKLDNAVQTILIKRSGIDKSFEQIKNSGLDTPILRSEEAPPEKFLAATAKSKKASAANTAFAAAVTTTVVTLPALIDNFFRELGSNPDPSVPENIVQINWAKLFDKRISDAGLLADYRTYFPNGELFVQTRNEVLAWVKNNTVVMQSEIENLLVSPETQAVKDGSNETSVFTVKAKIVEDGVFIKEVVDKQGVVQERFVEFD